MPIDTKTKLSTLWVFASLNYIYADVVSLIDPTSAYHSTTLFTPTFLLGASILVEIPIAMVLLSRMLKSRTSRWANIIAGALMSVIQTASLFVGTPALYYAFFSVMEIAATLAVVWYAWKWRDMSSPIASSSSSA